MCFILISFVWLMALMSIIAASTNRPSQHQMSLRAGVTAYIVVVHILSPATIYVCINSIYCRLPAYIDAGDNMNRECHNLCHEIREFFRYDKSMFTQPAEIGKLVWCGCNQEGLTAWVKFL